MKNILVLLSCFILTPFFVLAQSTSTGGPLKWNHILSSLELDGQLTNKGEDQSSLRESYIKFSGSPFLTRKPVVGWLVTNKGDRVEDLSLMYDLYGYHLFIIENDKETALKKQLIDEVHIPFDGADHMFKRAHPSFPDRFYEVLFEDDQYVFYKEHGVRLSEGQDNGMVKTDSKFMKKKTFYLTNKKKRKSAHQLNLKKKNMIKYLSKSRAKACKDYMESTDKFKLKSVESYVAMLTATSVNKTE